jgi:hypothetical protein
VLVSAIAAPSATARGSRSAPGPSRAEGHLLDKLKSIAVPVTRRAPQKKARRAGHPQVAPEEYAPGKVGAPRAQPRPVRPSSHRYHVGQRLRLMGGGSTWTRSSGGCQVVALVPHEGGAFYYRVRSETESFERIVAETDLSLPDLA